MGPSFNIPLSVEKATHDANVKRAEQAFAANQAVLKESHALAASASASSSVSEEELGRRKEFLVRQREILLKKKKNERDQQLNKYEAERAQLEAQAEATPAAATPAAAQNSEAEELQRKKVWRTLAHTLLHSSAAPAMPAVCVLTLFLCVPALFPSCPGCHEGRPGCSPEERACRRGAEALWLLTGSQRFDRRSLSAGCDGAAASQQGEWIAAGAGAEGAGGGTEEGGHATAGQEVRGAQ
jgi:hypothetical protein